MQKYNESIYPIQSSIPIILIDRNVSMTKDSKNMASYKKVFPLLSLPLG